MAVLDDTQRAALIAEALKNAVGVTSTEQARRNLADALDIVTRRVLEAERKRSGMPPLPPEEAKS